MDGEGMQIQRCRGNMMSPEIVEVEESKSFGGGLSRVGNDVYVTVGKDDLDVLKWAIDHALSPGSRVYLVHVFPLLTYIATPVGRLSKSQLSEEQVRIYVNEENNRRRNLLQKYVRLSNDSKWSIQCCSRAIVQQKPLSNSSLCLTLPNLYKLRRLRKKMGKGYYVKKNAPEDCKVSLVCSGKKVDQDNLHLMPSPQPSSLSRDNFFNCACFPARRFSR